MRAGERATSRAICQLAEAPVFINERMAAFSLNTPQPPCDRSATRLAASTSPLTIVDCG